MINWDMFIKANVASIVASIFDYLTYFVLVKVFDIDVVIAGAVGPICGGIINFLIGRNWVFISKKERVTGQMLRYILVWTGNLLLNMGGIYLFAKVWKLHFMASKLFVSLMVAVFYNYPLQKRFVFNNN